MVRKKAAIVLGRKDPVPQAEWNTSEAGELIVASHKNINFDTRSMLYKFILEFHLSDPNLHMLKRVGESIVSFTFEGERFLKEILNETTHGAVKAAFFYDLIQGYFSVSQLIRFAGLRGKTLSEILGVVGDDSSVNDSAHITNIRYWNEFTADELESQARLYAKRAKEECRKERLYDNSFDDEGNLFRKLITTLGRRVDVLLYQMDHFCIGKRVKNEEFTTLGGETVNLRYRFGKVALVDIWSTTCAPCRSKLPDLMELQKKLGEDSFEIITLNVDQSRETLADYIKKPEFVYIADDKARAKVEDYLLPYIDTPELTLPIAHIGLNPLLKLWDINAYPTLFLLDQNGVMHARGHSIPYEIVDDLMVG